MKTKQTFLGDFSSNVDSIDRGQRETSVVPATVAGFNSRRRWFSYRGERRRFGTPAGGRLKLRLQKSVEPKQRDCFQEIKKL